MSITATDLDVLRFSKTSSMGRRRSANVPTAAKRYVSGAASSKVHAKPILEMDPISLLETNEPDLFRDKKILIVDDLIFALERAKNIVGKRFNEEKGCSVEVANDPLKAIEMISLAKFSGRPYDVLVTDLYMQKILETGFSGINGDELLRRLAENDLFLPTVVFSGSWASDINQNLFEQLDLARSREEIHAVVNKTANSLGGIPLAQVNKTGDDVEKSLLYSIAGVFLMGKRASNGAIQDFLAEYKPKTLEDTPSREIISKALEVHRIYKEFLVDVKKQFEENNLEQTYSYGLIYQFLNHKEEWHLNSIGDASSHRARVFFHNLVPVMKWIHEHSVFDTKITKIISPQTLDKLEEFYRAMTFYAVSTKKDAYKDFNFNELIKNILKYIPHKIKVENLVPDGFRIPSNPYFINEIIMQPVTNAFKAIREKSNGEVKMNIREISKLDLPVQAEGERFVEVVIEDNGCGMSPEKVLEINERKCKEGNSTFGTLGWGLPILQDFMSKVGGAYHAESEVGKGTKFKLYFRVN